jgi:citrate lyase subunit beta / citryl-CoA lyase
MRSLLFVPADAERKIAKAASVGADVLILDLEDSVSADRKPAAREMARAVLDDLRSKASRSRWIVRINALDLGMLADDLGGVMGGRPSAIMLPKPTGGEDVSRLAVALSTYEERYGIEDGATGILPIVTEVPASVLALSSYVGASTRLIGLTWGAEDLSAELGSQSTREDDGHFTSPYRLARDLTLFAARAAGVEPIDTVFPNFRDMATFERECAAATRDGFTGKMAIHPDQVAVINAAFTPGVREIERARRIVGLFAASPGAGVISLDGQMVDKPHLRLAERLLARVDSAAKSA